MQHSRAAAINWGFLNFFVCAWDILGVVGGKKTLKKQCCLWEAGTCKSRMSFPKCLCSRVLCTESYSSKEKRWHWQLLLKDDKMALKCNATGDQKTSADFFWGQKHRNWCAVWKEVYPTQPSFISLSTHSLASTENNSRFRSKLAWFNLVLLVETEKWSLWKDGYGREKWGSSSLLKTKVIAIGEGTAAIKICWDCWKKGDI